MCFNLCLLPLVLSLGTTKKSLALLFALPSGIYAHGWGPLWAFASPGWAVPTQALLVCQMLQSIGHLSDLFAGLPPVRHCLSHTEEPRTGYSAPGFCHQGWVEGKDSLHWPAATLCSTAQDVVGFLCCKGTLLAHIQLISCSALESLEDLLKNLYLKVLLSKIVTGMLLKLYT